MTLASCIETTPRTTCLKCAENIEYTDAVGMSQVRLNMGNSEGNVGFEIFDKLVTKRDLARFLCVSEGLINKLVGERGLPHVKIGRTIRFSVKDVMSWLEQKGFKQ
jgi:excisionase family DNA binding protein